MCVTSMLRNLGKSPISFLQQTPALNCLYRCLIIPRVTFSREWMDNKWRNSILLRSVLSGNILLVLMWCIRLVYIKQLHLQVRALIEGQFLSMRAHSERFGMPSPPRRIIAAGGASADQSILTLYYLYSLCVPWSCIKGWSWLAV